RSELEAHRAAPFVHDPVELRAIACIDAGVEHVEARRESIRSGFEQHLSAYDRVLDGLRALRGLRRRIERSQRLHGEPAAHGGARLRPEYELRAAVGSERAQREAENRIVE